MPPEYITKGEYEKREAELRAEHKEDLFKLKKQIQEHRARYEEREKLVSRLWTERLVYISIIIVVVTLFVAVTSM
jgi:hypothetical protein